MSLTDALKKGMVIRHQDRLYTVMDFRVAQTGKQKPTVHVTLRSVKGGQTSERTLDQIGKLEEVEAEVHQMQYLYAAGQEHVFMDSVTFEQCPLTPDLLGNAINFLVAEESYSFLVIEDQPIEIRLPTLVPLEVKDTAPVEHAGGSSNVYKEAELASGLVIQVPLFIKIGDKVRVSTESREYLGKEH